MKLFSVGVSVKGIQWRDIVSFAFNMLNKSVEIIISAY